VIEDVAADLRATAAAPPPTLGFRQAPARDRVRQTFRPRRFPGTAGGRAPGRDAGGRARYLQEFIDLAHRVGVEPELLRSGEFLRQGGLDEDDKHQGVFLVDDPLTIYNEYDLDSLGEKSVVLVLDQVSNPQNFGTIIRTAAFFGVEPSCGSRTAPPTSPRRSRESPSAAPSW
jgi:hypothetical protein